MASSRNLSASWEMPTHERVCGGCEKFKSSGGGDIGVCTSEYGPSGFVNRNKTPYINFGNNGQHLKWSFLGGERRDCTGVKI